MKKAFVYGMSVEGENFTDRVKETKRLKLDFENGINVILVSPRRMGKSSIVKKVKSEINNPLIKVVYMDIYDCRSEYDFYNRFASALMKETVSKAEFFFFRTHVRNLILIGHHPSELPARRDFATTRTDC